MESSTAPKNKSVKFTNSRKTETVECPTYPGSKVELYTALTVEEQQEVTAKWPNPRELDEHEQTNMAVFMLTKAIKEWNFVGDDDQPLPRTEDVLRKFLTDDLLKMCEVPMGMKLLDEDNKRITDPLGGSEGSQKSK